MEGKSLHPTLVRLQRGRQTSLAQRPRKQCAGLVRASARRVATLPPLFARHSVSSARQTPILQTFPTTLQSTNGFPTSYGESSLLISCTTPTASLALRKIGRQAADKYQLVQRREGYAGDHSTSPTATYGYEGSSAQAPAPCHFCHHSKTSQKCAWPSIARRKRVWPCQHTESSSN